MLGQSAAQNAVLLIRHLLDELADAALTRAHLHPLGDPGTQPGWLEREPPARRWPGRVAYRPAERALRLELIDRRLGLPAAARLVKIVPAEARAERRAERTV